MGSIIFMAFLIVVGVVLAFVKVPEALGTAKKAVCTIAIMLGLVVGISGAVRYNDAGYNQHVQDIFGNETAKCDVGWYFEGWGRSTPWPHYITIANTRDPNAAGSAVSGPYPIRMADNWNGDVTQVTRFGIPRDCEAGDGSQFIAMHREFRSAERLITTTLKPVVTASLDSVSNLFSMEEYYAGGKRDAYKTEFRDAVIKGRPVVRQVTSMNAKLTAITNGQAPNDDPNSADTSDVGETQVRRIIMEKVLNADGSVKREQHSYPQYGITVSSAIVENLDPDDLFEKQIQDRKDAASRRIVAQEERREQEELRLLELQKGETEIAKKQAAARTVQIERTTNAETEKQLKLIAESQIKETAQIALETSEIKLEQAKIDAEARQVAADAAAYEKAALLEADNALALKLDALVQMNRDNAQALAKRQVPTNVIYTGGSEGGAIGANDEIANIAATQMLKNLKALDVDITVAPGNPKQ